MPLMLVLPPLPRRELEAKDRDLELRHHNAAGKEERAREDPFRTNMETLSTQHEHVRLRLRLRLRLHGFLQRRARPQKLHGIAGPPQWPQVQANERLRERNSDAGMKLSQRRLQWLPLPLPQRRWSALEFALPPKFLAVQRRQFERRADVPRLQPRHPFVHGPPKQENRQQRRESPLRLRHEPGGFLKPQRRKH